MFCLYVVVSVSDVSVTKVVSVESSLPVDAETSLCKGIGHNTRKPIIKKDNIIKQRQAISVALVDLDKLL